MAVLSRTRIEDRRKRDISNPGILVVTPLLSPDEVFDADSLDLRLGAYFLLPQTPPEPFFYPGRKWQRTVHRVHVPLGSFLVVPAHQTVLGATLEFLKLPHDVHLLYPGRTIGQLILLDVPDAEPTTQLEGQYVGSVYPEAPKFRNPEDDLNAIGVEETSVIPERRLVRKNPATSDS